MRGGWGYDEKWGDFRQGDYVLSCRDGIAPIIFSKKRIDHFANNKVIYILYG